jgi:hypothetical protein
MLAERRTKEESSSAVRVELSSSLGSIPNERTMALPTLFRTKIIPVKVQVKANWNPTTNLFT